VNEKNKKEKVPSLQMLIRARSSKLGKTKVLSKRPLPKSKQENQSKKMAEQARE